jgi:hypothetical protein
METKPNKCSVVDTWELLKGSSDERKAYLSDGLHLNEEGNRRVFDGLLDLLMKQFSDLTPMNDDEDGEGIYGTRGIPIEEKTWKELCGVE